MSGPAMPPIEPLRRVLARLEAEGVAHALGASGLCAALGLVDRVNDWDVTCEASLPELVAVFASEPHETFGNSGCHADHKLNLEGGQIELIARFAFFTPGGVVRIPTRVTRRWRDLPIGSPEAWAVAYALMGELEGSERRLERAGLLFGWLAASGADAATVRELREQPLPAGIEARLAALPLA